ncbi:copper resistance protein NlpE N-terminal domain-containing protein [Aquabacterium sp. A7-Y]|uniref:protease inhibitor I42 family protein n=1 Tax=Aquabacterium sp. A7-Y TaxID=1349605 RepID=UPI00223CFCB7|nr:protease inhibitor I42 family protein [Aquabacterium sp. A7-Y]MCW7538660.1 copper resistance protein NlpE N-terminal domain-containing protein [Aquabacterium sp. A7-Y]
MNLPRRLPVLLAALALAGCASWRSGSDAAGHQPPPGAVPVARYVGTLPCTDCAGVRTDLLLYTTAAGTPGGYSLRQTFLGGADPKKRTDTVSGSWMQASGTAEDAQASVIHLDPTVPERMRAFRQDGIQVLRALSPEGRELPAHLPRSLVRVPAGVPPASLVLTYADRGSDAEVKAGDQVVLLLASQPSSGYRWAALPDRLGAMKAQGEAQHVSELTPDAPGLDMFRFTAAGSGTQVLRVEYRSATDPMAKAADIATFNITVR